MTVPTVEAQPMVDRIVAAHKENYRTLIAEFRKGPSFPTHRRMVKPYEGAMPFWVNRDGTTTFRFASLASYVDRVTKECRAIPLHVVDSKGKRIEDVPAIAGGSELKVKFSMLPYGWSNVAGASVKLFLEGVMLVTLVETPEVNEWESEAVKAGYEEADSVRTSLVERLPWFSSDR